VDAWTRRVGTAHHWITDSFFNLVLDSRDRRRQYDLVGASARLLLFVMDGGFCNRTVFRAPRIGNSILVRCRKDANCACPQTIRPTQGAFMLRKNSHPKMCAPMTVPGKKTTFFIGDKWRPVRFKQISSVLWQGGAGNMPLRLIVIAPIPYRLSFHSRAFYRRPAYFLCDNLDLPLKTLIQASFDRWQIEVNHRDEKQHIGLQHPQMWNERSVDRLPAFMVASYSFLLLASLQAYGAKRSDQYLRPAKWQTAKRYTHGRTNRPAIVVIQSHPRLNLQFNWWAVPTLRACGWLRYGLRMRSNQGGHRPPNR
jgi:hypothetical protein